MLNTLGISDTAQPEEVVNEGLGGRTGSDGGDGREMVDRQK